MVKNPRPSAGDAGSIPQSERSPPAFLPGEFHGQRSLMGYYGPGGRKESSTTEYARLIDSFIQQIFMEHVPCTGLVVFAF